MWHDDASSRTPSVMSSPSLGYTGSSGSKSLSGQTSHDERFSYSRPRHLSPAEWYGYGSSQPSQHYYTDTSSLSSAMRRDHDHDPLVQYYNEQTSYGRQYSRTSSSSSSVSRTLSRSTSGYDTDYLTSHSSSSGRRTHRRVKSGLSAYTRPTEYNFAEDHQGYEDHNIEAYTIPSGARTDAGWADSYVGHGGGTERAYTIPSDTMAPKMSKHRPHVRRQHSAPTAQPHPLTSAGLSVTREWLAALNAKNARDDFVYPRTHPTKIHHRSAPREKSSAGIPPQYFVHERPTTERTRSHKSRFTAHPTVHHTVPSSHPAGMPRLPVPKNSTVVYDFLVHNKPGKPNFGKTELVRVSWQEPGKVAPWPAPQGFGAKPRGVSKTTRVNTRVNRSRDNRASSTTKQSESSDAGQQRRDALAAIFSANSRAPSRARTV